MAKSATNRVVCPRCGISVRPNQLDDHWRVIHASPLGFRPAIIAHRATGQPKGPGRQHRPPKPRKAAPQAATPKPKQPPKPSKQKKRSVMTTYVPPIVTEASGDRVYYDGGAIVVEFNGRIVATVARVSEGWELIDRLRAEPPL